MSAKSFQKNAITADKDLKWCLTLHECVKSIDLFFESCELGRLILLSCWKNSGKSVKKILDDDKPCSKPHSVKQWWAALLKIKMRNHWSGNHRNFPKSEPECWMQILFALYHRVLLISSAKLRASTNNGFSSWSRKPFVWISSISSSSLAIHRIHSMSPCWIVCWISNGFIKSLQADFSSW